MMETPVEIPARRGKAALVSVGQIVTVINTHGEQVVDTWAFNRADLGEFLSNEHTRAHSLHLVPKPGDVLRTNEEMIGLAHGHGFQLEQGLEGRLVRIQKRLDDAAPDLPCQKWSEIAGGAELRTA